jgi:hypothetical protein
MVKVVIWLFITNNDPWLFTLLLTSVHDLSKLLAEQVQSNYIAADGTV